MAEKIVKFEGVCPENGNLSFSCKKIWFGIKTLSNGGRAEIIIRSDVSINEIASMITDFFQEESNFFGFQTIGFEFHGVWVDVSETNASKEAIVAQYNKKWARHTITGYPY